MRARHFHPPCLCLNQIQNDKAVRIRGGGCQWNDEFFSPLHCYHPLPPSSLSSPFKSVTHYMSGQCVCVCVSVWVHVCARQEELGEDARIELSSPLCVWPESHWVSQKQLRERERQNERLGRGRGVYKRVERWREEGSSGGLREGEKVERERERELGRDGCLCVLVVVQGSGSFSRFEKRGWNKFKVLLKRSSVHIKIPNCPQTHELLEWTPYLLSAVVTIIQFEGHLFFDVTLISAAAQKRVIRVKSVRRFIGCTEGCQKRTQLGFQTRPQNTVAEVQHINNKYLHINVREITSGGKKQSTNTL